MSKNKNTLPGFESEEQEAEFWDTHSPLDFVSQPKLENVKATSAKDRPIAIRLDSETRDKLNELAAKQGLGPSTLARTIITRAVENKGQQESLDLNLLMNTFINNMSQAEREKFESFQKDVTIGDPGNPALLVFSGQRKNWEDVASIVMTRLLTLAGFHVISPETENYEKLKEIIQPRVSKTL